MFFSTRPLDFIGGDHGINSIKYPFLGYDGSIPSSPGPGYHFSHSVKLKNVRMWSNISFFRPLIFFYTFFSNFNVFFSPLISCQASGSFNVLVYTLYTFQVCSSSLKDPNTFHVSVYANGYANSIVEKEYHVWSLVSYFKCTRAVWKFLKPLGKTIKTIEILLKTKTGYRLLMWKTSRHWYN